MFAINCSTISKTYSSGLIDRNKLKALDLAIFQVKPNNIVGIVGPNGAGKSTLLKILMGFIKPDTGEAFISGRVVKTPEYRTNIGYLPENPCLYPHLSIQDHLKFVGRTVGMCSQTIKEKSQKILELVKLGNMATSPLKQYSKGMTQRAALAYALFTDPKILILDEPMSGLDPMGRQLVIDIMRQYHEKGATILFCSHILNDVERICTCIGIMNQGQMVKMTTPEALRQEHENRPNHLTPLEACFLETVTKQSV